ncbi:MAG: methyl-accepting chemotaxis protein, partial [Desulfovibrionaceae bacterium]
MNIRVVVVGVAAAVVAAVGAVLALPLGTLAAPAVGALAGALAALLGVRWAGAGAARAAEAAEQFAKTGDTTLLAGQGGPLAELAKTFSTQDTKRIFAENALKSLCNPVLVVDKNRRVLLATPAVTQLVDKPMTQIIGFTDSQVLWGTESGSVAADVLTHKETCMDRTGEFTLSGGKQADLRIFGSCIVGQEGDVQGAVLSIIDLHTVVEQQRRMARQQEEVASTGEEVRELAERVASASEELSASADEQANGAQRQKQQTDTVATAMEEMTATVLEVARNASATSMAAGEANDSAREGVAMVGQAVNAIHGVSESADKLANMVGQLDSQSVQIGKIISVINDIADQTNLLALNAAIEAARAGEAGRGFAVVADEVRKLAEKTMVATKEVEVAIKTIQERSKLAMHSMEETGKQVDQSTEMANKAGEALQVIMQAIEDMVNRAAQIATAAEEQSAAAEEINQSIESIAQVAAEADEGAGQTAAATRDLAELSQQLLAVSMQFSGKESGASRLRASEGEMKGVLPKLMQEYVAKTYGDAVYKSMQEELGNPVFLPTASYPDQVFQQMAEIVSGQAGDSTREIFLGVGKFTVKRFHDMYPRYFKDEDLKSFYLRMNDVHAL